MKTFFIESTFVVETETKEDAERIACAMQEKANDEGRKSNGFLLINERVGVEEGEVVINDGGGITLDRKGS